MSEFWLGLVAQAVAQYDHWTELVGQLLTGSHLLVALALGALPVLVAVLSRSAADTVASALFVLLAFTIGREGEEALALALYGTACIMGLHGLVEARRQRHVNSIKTEVAKMRGEMAVFLDALDRRARSVDEAHGKIVESRLGRELA